MSRGGCLPQGTTGRFPRVSGDEPLTGTRGDDFAEFSPRERG